MHRPARWAAIIGGTATLAAYGTGTMQKCYAFGINNRTTGPGSIPVPGTFSPGDQLIINDQLTTRLNSRYPIPG